MTAQHLRTPDGWREAGEIARRRRRHCSLSPPVESPASGRSSGFDHGDGLPVACGSRDAECAPGPGWDMDQAPSEVVPGVEKTSLLANSLTRRHERQGRPYSRIHAARMNSMSSVALCTWDDGKTHLGEESTSSSDAARVAIWYWMLCGSPVRSKGRQERTQGGSGTNRDLGRGTLSRRHPRARLVFVCEERLAVATFGLGIQGASVGSKPTVHRPSTASSRSDRPYVPRVMAYKTASSLFLPGICEGSSLSVCRAPMTADTPACVVSCRKAEVRL